MRAFRPLWRRSFSILSFPSPPPPPPFFLRYALLAFFQPPLPNSSNPDSQPRLFPRVRFLNDDFFLLLQYFSFRLHPLSRVASSPDFNEAFWPLLPLLGLRSFRVRVRTSNGENSVAPTKIFDFRRCCEEKEKRKKLKVSVGLLLSWLFRCASMEEDRGCTFLPF